MTNDDYKRMIQIPPDYRYIKIKAERRIIRIIPVKPHFKQTRNGDITYE